MSADKKAHVDMTMEEVELVIDALRFFSRSLGKESGRPEFAKDRPGELLEGKEGKIGIVFMLGSRLEQGLSGRGGKGFDIYEIGNTIISEQERLLLILQLKSLAAYDDYQAKREAIRWEGEKEWDRQFESDLVQKLNESG